MLTQVYCGCCLFRLSKVACGLFCHVFISSANISPFKNVSKCLLKECLHVFCFSQLLMFKDFRRGGFDLSRSQHAGFWRSGPCLWEVRHELVINASYCELRLALTKLTFDISPFRTKIWKPYLDLLLATQPGWDISVAAHAGPGLCLVSINTGSSFESMAPRMLTG